VPLTRTPSRSAGFFIFRRCRKIKGVEILPELGGMVWVDSKTLIENGFEWEMVEKYFEK